MVIFHSYVSLPEGTGKPRRETNGHLRAVWKTFFSHGFVGQFYAWEISPELAWSTGSLKQLTAVISRCSWIYLLFVGFLANSKLL
jgi:hypothetical protein